MSDTAKITVNYFCLGAFFIFIGSVLLCALGFTVVLPFELTRSWPSVLCSVVNSSFDPNVCSCDEQLSVFDTCVSKYPCLQIHVLYVPQRKDKGASKANGTEVIEKDGKGLLKAKRSGLRRVRRSVDLGNTDSPIGGLNGSVAALPAEEGRREAVTGSDVTRYPSDSTGYENFTRKSSSSSLPTADVSEIPTSGTNAGLAAVVLTEAANRRSSSDDVTSTSRPSTSLPGSYAGRGSEVNGVTEEVGWSPDEAVHTDAYSVESLQTRKTTERNADVERSLSGGATNTGLGQSASGPEPVIAVLYRSWEDSFHRQVRPGKLIIIPFALFESDA